MSINKVTYAGHSAILVETDKLVIAIDPWLSGNPSCPESLKSPQKIDLIVLTHGHSDHASDAPALSKKYGASIAANWELGNIMIGEGVSQDKVIMMNKGGTVLFNGIKITLTHALHSSSYDSPTKGTLYAGEACGVVITEGKDSLYHAGDTLLFSDMALIKEMYSPRIACLPIGDRFTMGPKEAAAAAKLVGCQIAIPIHFGTFSLLTGTGEQFMMACGNVGIRAVVLEPGESM